VQSRDEYQNRLPRKGITVMHFNSVVSIESLTSHGKRSPSRLEGHLWQELHISSIPLAASRILVSIEHSDMKS
jgi:hypothetical protein